MQGCTICDISTPRIADASLEPVALLSAQRFRREIPRCTFRSRCLVAESDAGTVPEPLIVGTRGCNSVNCARASARVAYELASIGRAS
jgi:hypothetical protein